MAQDLNPFKNASGARFLKALFYETTLEDKSNVIYTLKDNDHEGYPSLKRLYLECNDPCEYSFAIKYLDGIEHWDILTRCTWFKEYVAQWRHELDLRLRSQSLRLIMEMAALPASKDAYQAAKYLLEGGWKPKNEKGRPSKQQIKDEANRLAVTDRRLEEDFERIGRTN